MAFFQFRRAWLKAIAAEEAYDRSRNRFNKLSEEDRVALERIHQEISVDHHLIDPARHKALITSGFVALENEASVLEIVSGQERIVAQLLKEWRKGKKS